MGSRSSIGELSLSKALKDAFSFLPKAWGGAWLVFVLLLATHILTVHSALLGYLAPVNIIKAASFVAMLFISLMMTGALYRLALFGRYAKAEGLGFGGFQFGKPELRLICAAIYVILFVAFILSVIFIILAIALNLCHLEASLQNLGKIIFYSADPLEVSIRIYLILAFIFLVFVSLKLSLYQAATVAEHRIVSLNALGLTSGHVLKVFIGLCLLVLPVFLLGWGYAHWFISKENTPQNVHLWFGLGFALLGVVVIAPLKVGFLSSAYRQIVENRAKA